MKNVDVEVKKFEDKYSDNIYSTYLDLYDLNKSKTETGFCLADKYYFDDKERLYGIKISEGIETIETDCFLDCNTIREIGLPSTLKYIMPGAFESCSKLEVIDIPNGVIKIEEGTFAYCSSLMSVYLPNSVKEIGNRAFERCLNLKRIQIPKSVTSVKDSAFSYWGENQTIVFESRDSIKNSEFWDRGCKAKVIFNS